MAVSGIFGCFPESGFDGPNHGGPGEPPLGGWYVPAISYTVILDVTAISAGVQPRLTAGTLPPTFFDLIIGTRRRGNRAAPEGL